jgi:predicted dehydrogenase
MNQPLRVAVIGVGHLGQHHARLLAAMEGVSLAGVVDIKPGRAAEIGGRVGAQAFESAAALPASSVDAVTIAVPTVSHLEVALPFIDQGVAVLIEKPLAASVAEADRLIEAAARRGVTLATGHTERFNPAVVSALPLVTSPRFVEVHRLGTFPERSLDIDVVFDLMIHDLDVLLATVRSHVVDIEAVGVNVLTPRVDIANARLRFASGCIANVTASRISRDKVRKVRFFQPDSYVSIDYASREVEAYRLVAQNGRPGIQGGKLDVPDVEPLAAELTDFVAAVRHKREPGVSGAAGPAPQDQATPLAPAMETNQRRKQNPSIINTSG